MNYFYKKRLNKFKFIRRRKYNEKIIADYRRYCYRKIYFCKHSFKKISYEYIFKDSIKEVLGDTIGFSNREENKKLSSASMELMFFIFSEFASLEKDLILESNFHKSELEKLHKIAEDNGYDVLTIALFGDVDVLHERYLNRMTNENRHPVHLSTTIDKFEDFKKCSDYMRRIEIPGEVMQINATNFEYQSNEEVLAKIDAFMTK